MKRQELVRGAGMCYCKVMLTPKGLDEIVSELVARGYTRGLAEEYAVQIGDTPEFEEGSGMLVIRSETGEIIDRIEPLAGME